MAPILILGGLVILALALSGRTSAPEPAPSPAEGPEPKKGPEPRKRGSHIPPTPSDGGGVLPMPDRNAVPRLASGEHPRLLARITRVEEADIYAKGGFHDSLDAAERTSGAQRDTWINAANLYAAAFWLAAPEFAGPSTLFNGKIATLRSADAKADEAKAAGGATAGAYARGFAAGTEQDSVVATVHALRAGRASRPELAQAALRARALGLTETAQALAEAARTAAPLPGVTAAQWRAFAGALVEAEANAIDAHGRMGMFLYDPRRLDGLGVLANVHRDGDRWTGDWLAPWTPEAWAHPAKQFAVFNRDMSRLAPTVTQHHGDQIGQIHEGRRATLSGLLAVAHRAGPTGLAAWLRGERFEHTTDAYRRANGIF